MICLNEAPFFWEEMKNIVQEKDTCGCNDEQSMIND